MAKKSVDEKLADDRKVASRLRTLKATVGTLGKRGLEDTFAAGQALEEAAALLRGGFTGWVRNECGIDPRTALNFRKTFRVLGDRKDWLLENGVAPSVAVTLASASPEGRERAFAEIGAGRRLTAADAKLFVRATPERVEPRLPIMEPLKRAIRAFHTQVAMEVRHVIEAASGTTHTDATGLAALGTMAHDLQPFLALLDRDESGSGEVEVREFAAAVDALALARDAEDLRVAAAALVRVAGLASPHDASCASIGAAPADADHPTQVASQSGVRSVSSAFKHGLTAFELCAGGGGQVAGLAKAGFRHVALLEREKGPCQTLRAAFGPEHVIEADIVGYEPASDVGPVDLLAGGVPCQPFSRAGKKNGEYDDRDLFPEALRLVKRMRPRAVMLENVKGIMDPVNDGYRARILSKLSRMGYRCDWWVLNCADFGVPQRRSRAILVGFREPAAWARFKRLTSIGNFAEDPVTVTEALDFYLRSRGFDPTPDLRKRMNRVAPTIIGGSLKKQSSDLGQANTRAEWEGMGLVGKRWGHAAPGHDLVGDVLPTNAMMARLQGFAFDWPFQGKPRDVNRQIANALPTPVAFRLGLAVAEALTGETFDPMDQVVHEALRWNHVSRRRPVVKETSEAAAAPASMLTGASSRSSLADLRAASSMALLEGNDCFGEDHDIDYDRLRVRFGPWPRDLWKHQRGYGRL